MGELRCPDRAALSLFAAGRAAADQQREIAEHLQSCSRCRQVIEVATDNTSDHVPNVPHEAVQDPLMLAGSHLGLDLTAAEVGEEHTRLVPSLEEMELRFDFRLLEPPRDATAIGHLGKYTVRQVLGFGGMGVVFQAHDDQLLRVVALKVMSRELASSPLARRRFIREARAAAAINHPNVVIIHAVEEHQGTPFLVMEFIQGESLRDRLRHGPRLTLVEVVRTAYEVAAGLAAAHAHGVIHRDIKPANIMLQDGLLQRVKITDFGLARVAVDNVELTTHEMFIGTPAYMAPEQLHGDEIDARADLFSLGCVMHTMLRGHSPFHGKSAFEIARKLADERPAPLAADPSVPVFLAQMIDRLLEKSPAKRYQTAAEVAEELRQHLAAINQTPTDKLEELLRRRAASARPWLSAPLVGIAAGVVLLVGSIAAYQSGLVARSTAGKIEGANAAAATVPSVPATPITVSVAKSGAADCSSLIDALKKVGPYGTIKILDSGEYTDGVLIRDQQKHVGISIVGGNGTRPTLMNPHGGDVVRIENVPGVTLRGLKLVQQTDKQHALFVAGPAAGVTIDRVEMVGNSTKYSLVYFRSAWGEAGKAMVIRDSRIKSPKMAVVLESERPSEPVRHVQIVGNRFEGSATHVQLNVAVENARIAGNVFVGGTGVAIGLPRADSAGQIVIVNNTFFRNSRWLDLRDTASQVAGVEIRNNLILESAGSTIPSKGPLAEFVRRWTLAGNHWEAKAPSGESAVHGFAEIHERIAVVSRDAEHPQFLQPAAPLELSETAATDEPAYVGAIAPQAN